MQSLIREDSGNVVLTSDYFQLRFYQQGGGAPQEFWLSGMPGPITNPFAGSGCSVNYETGQDPTQSSSNGFTPNPVSRIDQATDKFYLRETLFDSAGAYGVEGTFPIYWASIEPADDYDPDGTATQFRTTYNPGGFAARISLLDCPVIFDGSTAGSGIFAVGNEMVPGELWNCKKGNIAFKTTISINDDTLGTSLAGIYFQKTIPEKFKPTKDDLYNTPGLRLIFNSIGGWELSTTNFTILTGQLSATHFANLKSIGLDVEIRSKPEFPGYLEIYLGADRKLFTVRDTQFEASENTWFGYFAQASNGYICFFYRQIYDLNVKVSSYYFARPNQRVISEQCIVASNCVKFYRANMPGIFLNSNIFSTKSTGYYDLYGEYVEYQGIVLLGDCISLWAGNPEGSLGLLATPIRLIVNGEIPLEAHAQILKSAHNNEFVLALNPFPFSWNTNPQAVSKALMVVEWAPKKK